MKREGQRSGFELREGGRDKERQRKNRREEEVEPNLELRGLRSAGFGGRIEKEEKSDENDLENVRLEGRGMIKKGDGEDEDGEGERKERVLDPNHDLAVIMGQKRNREQSLRDDGSKLQKTVSI